MQIIIEDNNCYIKTDCIYFLSFENNVITSVMHPEGMCIRENEIVYVEMKNIKTDNIDEIIDSVLNKVNNGLPLNCEKRDTSIVNEKYRKFVECLISDSYNFKISFYIVIPGNKISTFRMNLKNQSRLKHALKKVNAIFLCACGSNIQRCELILLKQ